MLEELSGIKLADLLENTDPQPTDKIPSVRDREQMTWIPLGDFKDIENLNVTINVPNDLFNDLTSAPKMYRFKITPPTGILGGTNYYGYLFVATQYIDSVNPALRETWQYLIINNISRRKLQGGIWSAWESVTWDNAFNELKDKFDVLLTNTINIHNGNGGFAAGYDASASHGIAIGNKAKETGGGVALGLNSASYSQGVALGMDAVEYAGGAAIGRYAFVYRGLAGGVNSYAFDGFAGGYNAKSNASNNIQLGEGENTEEKTFKVYDHTIMDADGFLYSKGEKVATEKYINDTIGTLNLALQARLDGEI